MRPACGRYEGLETEDGNQCGPSEAPESKAATRKRVAAHSHFVFHSSVFHVVLCFFAERVQGCFTFHVLILCRVFYGFTFFIFQVVPISCVFIVFHVLSAGHRWEHGWSCSRKKRIPNTGETSRAQLRTHDMTRTRTRTHTTTSQL